MSMTSDKVRKKLIQMIADAPMAESVGEEQLLTACRVLCDEIEALEKRSGGVETEQRERERIWLSRLEDADARTTRSRGEAHVLRVRVNELEAKVDKLRAVAEAATVNINPCRALIYEAIDAERRKQIREKGWTPGHDTLHTPHDWVALLTYELGELVGGGVTTDAARAAFIKIAAITVAGWEATP